MVNDYQKSTVLSPTTAPEKVKDHAERVIKRKPSIVLILLDIRSY